MLADESIELSGNLPSMSARGAFESFHGLLHAIRPGRGVTASVTAERSEEVVRNRTHTFQF